MAARASTEVAPMSFLSEATHPDVQLRLPSVFEQSLNNEVGVKYSRLRSLGRIHRGLRKWVTISAGKGASKCMARPYSLDIRKTRCCGCALSVVPRGNVTPGRMDDHRRPVLAGSATGVWCVGVTNPFYRAGAVDELTARARCGFGFVQERTGSSSFGSGIFLVFRL